MSEWAAKRFWKATAAVETEGGFKIELDGRPVKTPAKTLLVLPTADMAAAVASEWDAQENEVDPMTMPVTRGANAAIDKVAIQRAEVIDMLAAYGDTDLLCYRAEGPDGLVERQGQAWDPLLAWAQDTYGVQMTVGAGVMHIAQDPRNLVRFTKELDEMTSFEIAAAHDLISLSGSLIIAFAVIQKHLTVENGWATSRIDEEWQFEQWGEDEDARALESIKRRSFFDAAKFYEMSVT